MAEADKIAEEWWNTWYEYDNSSLPSLAKIKDLITEVAGRTRERIADRLYTDADTIVINNINYIKLGEAMNIALVTKWEKEK